jgi:hypothetical protein
VPGISCSPPPEGGNIDVNLESSVKLGHSMPPIGGITMGDRAQYNMGHSVAILPSLSGSTVAPAYVKTGARAAAILAHEGGDMVSAG